MAEGQEIEEPERKERLSPLPVLPHLAFHRRDVGEHVPVRDDDALGLGRRPGREHDLCDVISREGNRRRLAATPLDLVQTPDRRAGRVAKRRHVLTDEDQLGGDDMAHAGEEIWRGPIVNRHDDDAAENTPPEGDDPLRAIFTEEDDVVAFAQSCVVHARGEPACGPPHFPVREPAASIPIVVDKEVAARPGEIVEKINERVTTHM